MAVPRHARQSNLLYKLLFQSDKDPRLSLTSMASLVTASFKNGFTSVPLITELPFSDRRASPPTTFKFLLDQPFTLTLKSNPSTLPQA